MSVEYKPIKVNEWEEFGGGFLCKSFYKKDDDTVMLKLYEAGFDEKEIIKEHDYAVAVRNAGVKTPECLGLVETDDGRKGVLFQRIKNKKSFARMSADNPEKAFEYGEVFGTEAKKLHSLKCDKNFFPSKVAELSDIIRKTDIFTKEENEKIVKFLESNSADTCIHGDFHFGNLIQTEGEIYWIDLGDFSYGDYRLDLGPFMFVCVYAQNEELSKNLFHCDRNTRIEFWKGFVKSYTGIENDDDRKEFEKSLMPYMGTYFLFFIKKGLKLNDFELGLIKECFAPIIK